MTWTNGEVTVGDFVHGTWVFEEHLPLSAPETVCPTTGVRYSPTDALMRYHPDRRTGTWSMGVCEIEGLQVLNDDTLGEEFTETYDQDLAPDWLSRLAADRIKLLSATLEKGPR